MNTDTGDLIMAIPLIRIATHNNIFHDDDVVAVAILKAIFKNVDIVRTRDKEIIDSCDIVVDVGDEYNHTTRRFDHHMKNPPRDDDGHVLSSAGLIWRHYANTYLSAIKIPKTVTVEGVSVDLHTEVKNQIQYEWIHPIDLVDNGELGGPTIISAIVRSFRPIASEKTSERCDEQFEKVVDIIGETLERSCFHHVENVLSRARFMVGEKSYLEDGKIFLSDKPVPSINQFCKSPVHFVIYPVQEFIDDPYVRYNINPVPNSPRERYKTSIPNRLMGMRGPEIEKTSGCKGISFIHNTGFLAKAESKEAAITFCKYVLAASTVEGKIRIVPKEYHL